MKIDRKFGKKMMISYFGDLAAPVPVAAPVAAPVTAPVSLAAPVTAPVTAPVSMAPSMIPQLQGSIPQIQGAIPTNYTSIASGVTGLEQAAQQLLAAVNPAAASGLSGFGKKVLRDNKIKLMKKKNGKKVYKTKKELSKELTKKLKSKYGENMDGYDGKLSYLPGPFEYSLFPRS